MVINWKILTLLLLLLGCFLITEAGAQRLAGELVLKRGLIKVRRQGREQFFRTPGLSVPIFERDIVQSGPNTRAIISMRRRRETIQMYSNSHIAIDTLRPRRTRIGMAIGKALFSVARSLKIQPRFLVRTQTSSIGVKGTKFIVGNEETKSYVLSLEGRVGVVSKARPKVEVELKEGQALVAEKDKPLSQVVEVSKERQEAIIREDGLGLLRELRIPEAIYPYSDIL